MCFFYAQNLFAKKKKQKKNNKKTQVQNCLDNLKYNTTYVE